MYAIKSTYQWVVVVSDGSHSCRSVTGVIQEFAEAKVGWEREPRVALLVETHGVPVFQLRPGNPKMNDPQTCEAHSHHIF